MPVRASARLRVTMALGCALAACAMGGCYASRAPGDTPDGPGPDARDAGPGGPDSGSVCAAAGVYRVFARVEASDPPGCTETSGQAREGFVDIAFPFDTMALEGCARGSTAESAQTGACEWTLTERCGSPFPGFETTSVSVLGFADGALYGRVEHSTQGDPGSECAWTVRVGDGPP